MKKNHISFLIIIFLIIYWYNSIYASFTPIQNTSWNRACLYSMSWQKVDWTTFFEDWEPVECEKTLDFRVLVDDWEHRPDGIYTFSIKANDSNQAWDNKSYVWEATIDKSNKYWISTWWPYKVDTTPPSCILKEIRIPAWKWNNLYYNNWRLYYKSIDWIGEFRITLEADDTNNWTYPNTSKLKKIEFPTLLWVTPDSTIYSAPTWWKQTITWIYNWSWNNSSTWDILNNSNRNFCFDYAWNETPLKTDSNTKLIIEDWNHTITWITSLILTPDSQAPTVAWNSYNPLSNWIKYISWNNWDWLEDTIYDWDTSKSKFFAALDNRRIIIPSFRDTWSWLKSFQVKIEKYDDKSVLRVYDRVLSTKDSKVDNLSNVNIDHNFSLIDLDLNTNWYRNYTWNIETLNLWWNTVKTDEICDMVWNCISTPTPDFKVVANSPILATNTSITSWNNWTKHNLNSDYSWNENMVSNLRDKHTSLVFFEDKYWNGINSVSWVKNIELKINLENTLWCDQYNEPEKWDCVDFKFKNWNQLLNWTLNPTALEYKDFTYLFTNYNQFKGWELNYDLKSAIPTKNEYKISWWSDSLYWNDLTAKLQLNNLSIKVDNLLSYDWIWENPSDFNIANNTSNKPIYKWDPIVNYNLLWSIYPLVEWQQKTVNIWKIGNDNDNLLIKYELETRLWTNNFFLQFNNIALLNWNIETGWKTPAWSENYYLIKNSLLTWVWRWEIPFNSGSDKYNFIPKTIWWINDWSTKLALYSVLNYIVWWKNVKIPSVQSWFKWYWPYVESDFLDNSSYHNDSNIVLSEIDIRWITQTRTTSLWGVTWEWAVSTDNSTYKDVSSIKLYDLKTQVNKNVETLLAWSDRNEWTKWSSTITSFDFSTQWWLKLNQNNLIYFKDRDVTIDCWNTCNISWKKTIVVENWNIILRSNLNYNNNNSIIWFILIWNKDWNTSQFRISENITNWVWVIYSEWPIVSINNSNTKVYNWANTENTNLVNQLYWKWSFASRNTVWWAIKDNAGVCPYGTAEYNTSNCTIEKAQWYDLIYLRRYARVIKDLYWVTNNLMWDDKIPLNIDKVKVKIAWWDEFEKSWNILVKTINWTLAKPEKNNLNAPLIIEYDSKLQSSPPLWFFSN